MEVSMLDKLNGIQTAARKSSPEDLRKAAIDFESILLMQLTSALNKSGYETSDGDDEPLFGGDGGTGLAKQLFSEQMAKAMAEAGGLGLANTLMRQLGVAPEEISRPKGFDGAITSFKEIQREGEGKQFPLINRSAKPIPLERMEFAGNPNDAEVISTFEDQARSEGIEESLRHLILDGRVVNTTRPRVAPNAPITEVLKTGAKVEATGTLEYQFPVNGRMSSDFGNRDHPIDRKVKFHAGLDLAVPRGTGVEASADGEVSFAGWSGGYGNLLVIKHPDGRETRYAHLDKVMVQVGDKVMGGQQVALSGSTGKSTGPHLHFEIRQNGQVLNPLNILTKGLE